MTGKISVARRKGLLFEINRLLYQKYGTLQCKLNYSNPFELLIATMLSAQCTDDRVNQVTPNLFSRFPDAAAFAAADPVDIENAIRTAGLFRAKAKNIMAASRMLIERYNSEIPADITALTSLPGVGRKTANVVLGDAFGVPGFPVDTHVKRVLNRLAVTVSGDPAKIEIEVNSAIAPEYWTNLSHLLIMHGRETCQARKPGCDTCLLLAICKYYKIKKKI